MPIRLNRMVIVILQLDQSKMKIKGAGQGLTRYHIYFTAHIQIYDFYRVEYTFSS